MSATTGQVYLQVFDKKLNLFRELQTGLAPLNLVIIPTGVGILPFSGLSISNIRIDKIDTEAVNIGSTNVLLDKGISIGRLNSSFPRSNVFNGDNINIGIFNSASGSNLINIGATNLLSDVNSSLNIGRTSQVYKSSLVNNIGSVNNFSGVNTAFNLGSYNLFVRSKSAEQLRSSDVWEVYTFGDYNSFVSGARNIINIGDGNYFQKARNATLLGNTNFIYNSDITGSSSITLGDNNSSYNSTNYIMLGLENDIYSSYKQIIIGMNNANINQGIVTGNLIIGFENSSSGNNNYLFGNNNFILGDEGFILGNRNTALSNANSDTIIGSINLLSGTYNNYIFGDNNNIGRFIPGVLNNFYIGQNNLSDSGNNNYIIGIYNENSKTDNSYIIGQENVIKNTNQNYIFGANNQSSGIKNHIIGNNNILRTGDNSSIIIGYNYQPTGQVKNHSIILNSPDGSFEITQDGINISSDIRPKYNNSEILIEEDLQGYAKQENLIGRSGFYNNTIFQDPAYNFNADEIQLQTFNYSGRGERYYTSGFLGFTGINYNRSLYTFDGTNYFNKIPSVFYTGNKSILGNYFYESKDKDLYISYTVIVPNQPVLNYVPEYFWAIRRYEGDGAFYINRNNNYNTLPLSGWIATGLNGLSGGNPAPALKLVTEFTGIFSQKKLKSSFNKAYNFNSFISYPSDEISVIYGTHSSPKFDPTWLIVDNYSSGIYYINNNYNSNQTPQTGWSITGFAGSSGFYTNPNSAPIAKLQGRTGINLSMGTRVGVISTDLESAGGRIYIPYFY